MEGDSSLTQGLAEVVTALEQQRLLRAEFAAIAERLAEAAREACRVLGEVETRLVLIASRLEGTAQEIRDLRDGLVSERTLRESLVVRGCLGVLDDLRRAWTTAPAEADEWGEGIRLIYDNLEALVRASGVEAVRASPGEPFDPAVHRAVAVEGEPEGEPPVVLGEVQPGYSAGGRVIRPVEVRVGRPSRPPAVDQSGCRPVRGEPEGPPAGPRTTDRE